MRSFDPFLEQKKVSLHQSVDAIQNLAAHIHHIHKIAGNTNLEATFLDLLQVRFISVITVT